MHLSYRREETLAIKSVSFKARKEKEDKGKKKSKKAKKAKKGEDGKDDPFLVFEKLTSSFSVITGFQYRPSQFFKK